MSPEETQKYLQDHWNIYLAQEMVSARFRAYGRLIEHLPDLAHELVAHAFVSQLTGIERLDK